LALWRHHQRRRFRPFALSLIAPGAGFLLWAQGDGKHRVHLTSAGVWFGAVAGASCGFATGNFHCRLLVWLLSAVTAGADGSGRQRVCGPELIWRDALWSCRLLPDCDAGGVAFAFAAGRPIYESDAARNAFLATARCDIPGAVKGGTIAEDLQLMRLLLDRALQPVRCVEGFEWLISSDAAVRIRSM